MQLLDSQVQVNDVVWLLVSGSTNSMQTGLANAQVKFEYVDGSMETLELVPPYNYWSMVRHQLSLVRVWRVQCCLIYHLQASGACADTNWRDRL